MTRSNSVVIVDGHFFDAAKFGIHLEFAKIWAVAINAEAEEKREEFERAFKEVQLICKEYELDFFEQHERMIFGLLNSIFSKKLKK